MLLSISIVIPSYRKEVTSMTDACDEYESSNISCIYTFQALYPLSCHETTALIICKKHEIV